MVIVVQCACTWCHWTVHLKMVKKVNFMSCTCVHACWVTSVVTDSAQPYGLYPTRLLYPCDSPGLPPEDIPHLGIESTSLRSLACYVHSTIHTKNRANKQVTNNHFGTLVRLVKYQFWAIKTLRVKHLHAILHNSPSKCIIGETIL